MKLLQQAEKDVQSEKFCLMHREYGCAVLRTVRCTDTQYSSQSERQPVKPSKPRELSTSDAKAR